MLSLLSIPSDPTAIAEVLATLIRADRRTGNVEQIASKVRYGRDGKVDFWANPRELNAAGKGDCAKLVRAAAQFVEPSQFTFINVARTAAGFHCWITTRLPNPSNAKGYDETRIDPSVDRGMPRPAESVYASGVAVRLWPEGKEAVKPWSIAAERPQNPGDYLRAAMRLPGAQPPAKRKALAIGHLREWLSKAESEKEKREIAALLAVLTDQKKEIAAIKRKLAERDNSPSHQALLEAAQAVKDELPSHGVPLPDLFGGEPAVMGAVRQGAGEEEISEEDLAAILATIAPGCPGSCDAP